MNIKAFFPILLLALLVQLRVYAGDGHDVDDLIQTLKTSINRREIKNIAIYFDNTIELTLDHTHSTYSKDHAKILLTDFFAKANPKTFRVDYKGIDPELDAQYIVGTAYTETGSFRIYLFIKNKSGKFIIQEMKVAP